MILYDTYKSAFKNYETCTFLFFWAVNNCYQEQLKTEVGEVFKKFNFDRFNNKTTNLKFGLKSKWIASMLSN